MPREPKGQKRLDLIGPAYHARLLGALGIAF